MSSTADRDLQSSAMLLAGDVGGTKTFIGLFARGATRPEPSTSLVPHARLSRSRRAVDAVSSRDRRRAPADIEAASFGVAGPVTGTRAQLTNVPWIVDLDALRGELPVPRAYLLNDLEALAWSVPVLNADEIEVLHEGQADRSGQRRADCGGHRPRHRAAAQRRRAPGAARI